MGWYNTTPTLNLAHKGTIRSQVGYYQERTSRQLFGPDTTVKTCDYSELIKIKSVTVTSGGVSAKKDGDVVVITGDQLGRASLTVETENGSLSVAVNVDEIDSTFLEWVNERSGTKKDQPLVLLQGSNAEAFVSYRGSSDDVLGDPEWPVSPPWSWMYDEEDTFTSQRFQTAVIDGPLGTHTIHPPGEDAYEAKIVSPVEIDKVLLCNSDNECIKPGEYVPGSWFDYKYDFAFTLVLLTKDDEEIYGDPVREMRIAFPGKWRRALPWTTTRTSRDILISSETSTGGPMTVELFGASYVFRLPTKPS